MAAMASHITNLAIFCSTVCSRGTDQRKHQSSASLAFVRGVHRSPVNSPHKGPVTREMFPFDDVIMLCFWRESVQQEADIVPTGKSEQHIQQHFCGQQSCGWRSGHLVWNPDKWLPSLVESAIGLPCMGVSVGNNYPEKWVFFAPHTILLYFIVHVSLDIKSQNTYPG